ncbi:MAG TPA: hypothetical protein VGA11_05575 [Acidimicrobiia bacterium]
MKATVMLCDAAQAVDGKLYILGGGWTFIGPEPSPFAIAVIIEVPWDQANKKHTFKLDLVDEDGQPVALEGPAGTTTLSVTGDFEVGRPPGLREGTPLNFSVAINSGPVPLAPGRRYSWMLSVDGHSDEDWPLSFDVRPAV